MTREAAAASPALATTCRLAHLLAGAVLFEMMLLCIGRLPDRPVGLRRRGPESLRGHARSA